MQHSKQLQIFTGRLSIAESTIPGKEKIDSDVIGQLCIWAPSGANALEYKCDHLGGQCCGRSSLLEYGISLRFFGIAAAKNSSRNFIAAVIAVGYKAY
jgi:hypothetical protein